MSIKMSIWSTQGRAERIGINASESRLQSLKKKRIKHLKEILPKLKKKNMKKANRVESKLAYLT